MSRHPRKCPPGSLQRVIPRFVNREFHLSRDGARADYFDRMARAGALVALSASGVSYLLHGNPEATARLRPQATAIAAACWAETAKETVITC